MRDAFGGIVNISMIVVFLVVVSGYLAFNVSYTKAFRMKNKIITTIEQYEGACGSNSPCAKSIDEYAKSIGYSPADFSEPQDGCATIHYPNSRTTNGGVSGYYIGKCEEERDSDTSSFDLTRSYYRVETAIDISIPVINNIMSNMRVFRLAGSTKLITEK